MRKHLTGRNRLLFVLGINFGLRISDLLSLKVSDVIDENGKARAHFDILEEKTKKKGKLRRVTINAKAKAELKEQGISEYSDAYLFPSRKGDKPIGRVQAYRILNEAAANAGIDEVGTHTLRKTFGYHAYKAGTPIEVIQKVFNHSTPHVTLAYIGISADNIKEVYTVAVNL